MKRAFAFAALIAFALALAGCGDTENAKITGGKAKAAKVLECYALDPEYPDDKNPCWVEFPDGMQCLRSDNVHGDVYNECTGGRARKTEVSPAPADTF